MKGGTYMPMSAETQGLHDLALLYLSKQNISGLTPDELLSKYLEIMEHFIANKEKGNN